MQALASSLDALCAEGRIPSLSLCVRVDGREVFHRTVGLARLDPPRPAAEDQAYDLASVTKALAGATVTASLVEDGTLALDAPVAAHLPDVDPRITLRHLLEHTSGLPWWRPLYEEAAGMWGTAATRDALLRRARTWPLEAEPGTRYSYSDLGFLTLLSLLEAAGGAPLEVLLHQRVLRPAGARDLRWGWPGAAATERCPVRGALVEGTVHDLNCAALGGVSTHAGLFGTARAVAGLAEALLEATRGERPGLPGATLARFWTEPGPGSHVCGFDRISAGYTSTGRWFPPDTVGHLGYTGTSVWIAPSRRAVVALLTNRVHPDDEKTAIREARPRVHDAVAGALGWSGLLQ